MSIRGEGVRRLMEKSILNFHFDYLNPSLRIIEQWWTLSEGIVYSNVSWWHVCVQRDQLLQSDMSRLNSLICLFQIFLNTRKRKICMNGRQAVSFLGWQVHLSRSLIQWERSKPQKVWWLCTQNIKQGRIFNLMKADIPEHGQWEDKEWNPHIDDLSQWRSVTWNLSGWEDDVMSCQLTMTAITQSALNEV